MPQTWNIQRAQAVYVLQKCGYPNLLSQWKAGLCENSLRGGIVQLHSHTKLNNPEGAEMLEVQAPSD